MFLIFYFYNFHFHFSSIESNRINPLSLSSAKPESATGKPEDGEKRNGNGAGTATGTATTKPPKSRPDHGVAHVPGAGPIDMAPKSLDHFKRGYKERAAMRDKQFCDQRNRGGNHHHHGGDKNYNSRDSVRGLPQPIIMGMDVQGLVDRISRPGTDFDGELDKAFEGNAPVFECGKASTAIITAAARQRNVRLADNFWKWMDRAGLKKNAFHYNAMISAVGYQPTLTLLKEMTDLKIEKNEVT